MSDVHVFGYCVFEVVAVQQILACSGMKEMPPAYFREKDIPDLNSGKLIVCLSSEPFLGWARNIHLIKKLLHRHLCEIIVLTPGRISTRLMNHHRLRFIRGNIAGLNALKYSLKKKKIKDKIPRFRPWILNRTPEQHARDSGVSVKTVYHHRNAIVKALGFSTFHHMRLCMAGCSDNVIADTYSDLYSMHASGVE